MTAFTTEIHGMQQISALLKNLDNIIEDSLKKELMKFGLQVEKIAKQHIAKQDLDWIPLNEKYLTDKIKRGESEFIYVATSSYFQSITSFITTDGKHLVIGLKKGDKNSKGEDLFEIAKGMEFGGTNLPARPLWQPTGNEAVKLLDEMSKSMATAIVFKVKSRSGV